jgi:hypothetical protein
VFFFQYGGVFPFKGKQRLANQGQTKAKESVLYVQAGEPSCLQQKVAQESVGVRNYWVKCDNSIVDCP